jgi:hypothetical protein
LWLRSYQMNKKIISSYLLSLFSNICSAGYLLNNYIE